MTGAQNYSPLSTAKAALRREIIRRRDALDAAARTTASHRITGHILSLECFQRARCVLAYASMGSEFDTGALLLQVMAGKKLVLPRVDKASRSLQLYFVQNLESDLQPGVWGIREPRADRCTPAQPHDIDWVLTPGVAFTRRGARLGYGGGYYDQLLARFSPIVPRPVIVAAAFDMQIATDVPLDATDLPVDYVVTEDAICTR